MRPARGISIIPVLLAGEILPGDGLVEKLGLALRHQKLRLKSGDILVVKHKIISKAEGQVVRLADVKPSRVATAWARKSGTEARLVELVLSQSRSVIRKGIVGRRGILITETRHGFICANSGVDVSNVNGGGHALLLPKDSDSSAARLRSAIKKEFGVVVAVIITDSFGRPWREGLTEVAIGVAGMRPLVDHRGKRDPHGYVLHATAEAVADELACAAGLVCGKLNRTPFCIVRGFKYYPGRGTAQELVRAPKNDLFR
jgi:coenzyme F420-0:L-glutamate ligase / coenzyme F420-1:gamma-L-glutamate ligase